MIKQKKEMKDSACGVNVCSLCAECASRRQRNKKPTVENSRESRSLYDAEAQFYYFYFGAVRRA